MGREFDDVCQEDANDVPMLEDEEMVESELEFSDDEPDLETTSYDPEIGDVSKVLLGIKGSHLKYTVCSMVGEEILVLLPAL